jgi:S1-C subfamily serine protease
MAGRSFLSATWADARPIADDDCVFVQLPKQNSAAVQAGLQIGDVSLAAGGQEIESLGVIQSAVRNTEPGEEIQLTVRRSSDELEEVALVHP